LRKCEEGFESQERELENLRSGIDELKSQTEERIRYWSTPLRKCEEGIESHRRQLERLRSGIDQPKAQTEKGVAATELETLRLEVGRTLEIPMRHAESLDGIIAYLTSKHNGNVHKKQIVTITSASQHINTPAATADFHWDYGFISADAPGQWVCWDFRGMRVRPAGYTIQSYWLGSWVLEGSLDGESWTVLDRRTEDRDSFMISVDRVSSFPVSNGAECRFIRLTQTGMNRDGNLGLYLTAVEFFGTLFEGLSSRISEIAAVHDKLEMAALTLRIPMKGGKDVDGIMAYLARKHRGNVHDKGIVTINSKSVSGNPMYDPKYAHDFIGARHFESGPAAGQWVLWDFREMRITLTGYTLSALLKSWVLEGSLDGQSWTEIDQRTDPEAFRYGNHLNSFPVETRAGSRFLRLTQIGKNGEGKNVMCFAVEFFGTLSL
jgi:hypothetical protein